MKKIISILILNVLLLTGCNSTISQFVKFSEGTLEERVNISGSMNIIKSNENEKVNLDIEGEIDKENLNIKIEINKEYNIVVNNQKLFISKNLELNKIKQNKEFNYLEKQLEDIEYIYIKEINSKKIIDEIYSIVNSAKNIKNKNELQIELSNQDTKNILDIVIDIYKYEEYFPFIYQLEKNSKYINNENSNLILLFKKNENNISNLFDIQLFFKDSVYLKINGSLSLSNKISSFEDIKDFKTIGKYHNLCLDAKEYAKPVTLKIIWDQNTNYATIVKKDISKTKIDILDYKIYDERIYIPLRKVCEELKYELLWDSNKNKAYVKSIENVFFDGEIYNGNVYVKLREIEKLGVDITFGIENNYNTAIIKG